MCLYYAYHQSSTAEAYIILYLDDQGEKYRQDSSSVVWLVLYRAIERDLESLSMALVL